MGHNAGTLDGEVVRIVRNLAEETTFADAVCAGEQRTNLVVDGDTIVAAVRETC